jgi:MscS family membrane protein
MSKNEIELQKTRPSTADVNWIVRLSLAGLLAMLLLMTACGMVSTITPSPMPSNTPFVANETAEPPTDTPQETEESIIIPRTPEPTATPGVISQTVAELASSTGIDRVAFLGLTGEDWINLFISLLFITLGILLFTRLIYAILLRLTKLTPTPWDDEFVRKIRKLIYFLVIIISLQFAFNRLVFIEAAVKQWMNNIFFSMEVIIIAAILWNLTDDLITWYRNRIARGEEEVAFDTQVPTIRRIFHIILIIVTVIIVLDRYGVNISALLAVLGLGGLAISLAARDTLEDMINGFIILADRPFRVGDRIEIQDLNTWGDVVDIGTRTTRIRTRDNRMVIVPNSNIGKGQVVNYTFPDPRLRIETDISIQENNNLEQIRETILETLRSLEGVLLDEPVDALVLQLEEGSIKFRIRCWISSYADKRRFLDKVLTALFHKFNQNGIHVVSESYDILLKLDPDDLNRITRQIPTGSSDTHTTDEGELPK